MSDDAKKAAGVSGVGAFAIGLFLGGGLMLVYHAIDTNRLTVELKRASDAGDDFRHQMMLEKLDREDLRKQVDEMRKKMGLPPAAAPVTTTAPAPTEK